MFAMEAQNISPSEMGDSLEEMVNMGGCGVKSLLPETCALSFLIIEEEQNLTIIVLGSTPIEHSIFACLGKPIQVTLLEKRY